jgi:hypothetical protein
MSERIELREGFNEQCAPLSRGGRHLSWSGPARAPLALCHRGRLRCRARADTALTPPAPKLTQLVFPIWVLILSLHILVVSIGSPAPVAGDDL